MENEIFFSVKEGLGIPMSKIDIFSWKAMLRGEYSITINGENSILSFELNRSKVIVLTLYAQMGEKSVELDSHRITTSSESENLTASHLFTNLNKKQLAHITETMADVVKYRTRVRQLTDDINKLSEIIAKDDLPQHESWRDLNKKLNKRRELLENAEDDLEDFIVKRSKNITEEVSINEARQWEDWTPDAEDQYRTVASLLFNGSPMNFDLPEEMDAEADVDDDEDEIERENKEIDIEEAMLRSDNPTAQVM